MAVGAVEQSQHSSVPGTPNTNQKVNFRYEFAPKHFYYTITVFMQSSRIVYEPFKNYRCRKPTLNVENVARVSWKRILLPTKCCYIYVKKPFSKIFKNLKLREFFSLNSFRRSRQPIYVVDMRVHLLLFGWQIRKK